MRAMEFNSAEFFAASEKDRVSKCRAFAAEAERLARAANGDTRDGYLELAKKWVALADEMEALISGDDHG
jgi:hypothetical protein